MCVCVFGGWGALRYATTKVGVGEGTVVIGKTPVFLFTILQQKLLQNTFFRQNLKVFLLFFHGDFLIQDVLKFEAEVNEELGVNLHRDDIEMAGGGFGGDDDSGDGKTNKSSRADNLSANKADVSQVGNTRIFFIISTHNPHPSLIFHEKL